METRANYVAVGAFVIVVLLAAFVSVLWLVGGQFQRDRVFLRGPAADPLNEQVVDPGVAAGDAEFSATADALHRGAK